MILTRHFVFVHIPKTGGNFVRRILEEHAAPDWQVQRLDDHLTYADVPASHRELPRLAFVRNPFAWYVSWYYFQKKTRDDFFLQVSDNGALGFAATMRNTFRARPALEHGEGPFLQTLWHMLGPGLEGSRVGRMEALRQDLSRLMQECCEVPAAMQCAIDSLPSQNTSKHGHYSQYYDDELRDLVLAKDRAIFDHFGYRWESAGAN
ncbi:MAG: sulfotransferase family 2 domain-containing protein [bacterium]|nr:sulfotransferase family 2 domain-containing protein [bacterium]